MVSMKAFEVFSYSSSLYLAAKQANIAQMVRAVAHFHAVHTPPPRLLNDARFDSETGLKKNNGSDIY